jgi:hypothetical protein
MEFVYITTESRHRSVADSSSNCALVFKVVWMHRESLQEVGVDNLLYMRVCVSAALVIVRKDTTACRPVLPATWSNPHPVHGERCARLVAFQKLTQRVPALRCIMVDNCSIVMPNPCPLPIHAARTLAVHLMTVIDAVNKLQLCLLQNDCWDTHPPRTTRNSSRSKNASQLNRSRCVSAHHAYTLSCARSLSSVRNVRKSDENSAAS